MSRNTSACKHRDTLAIFKTSVHLPLHLSSLGLQMSCSLSRPALGERWATPCMLCEPISVSGHVWRKKKNIHSHMYTETPLSLHWTFLCMFGMRGEARVPREKPHNHWENNANSTQGGQSWDLNTEPLDFEADVLIFKTLEPNCGQKCSFLSHKKQKQK